jgi:predicted TIM-barrel fold metal-dependent hydrolase
MDREGVDVNLTLPSSWFGTFTANEDVELEAAMYRAYNRWMADYCAPYPTRIKGVILVCYRDLAKSLEELERRSQENWPLAAFVYAPTGVPLDHPNLEPVWAACQHHDLSVALHTFTQNPAVLTGRTGYLGQSLAAALCRSFLVRTTKHGGADWSRSDGSLPKASHRNLGSGAQLAAVLDDKNG